jgi:hypothetical protein
VHATTARGRGGSGRDGTVAVGAHNVLLRLRLRPGEGLLAGRHDVCVDVGWLVGSVVVL